MYSTKFCNIYGKYGWNAFPETFGNVLLKYFDSRNKKINKHIDIACGNGTLCNIFYNQKINTKGIDISREMINEARLLNPNIDFEVADLTTYNYNDKYDLVTCTCDAINHILNYNDICNAFKNIFDALNSDGYFVFDIIDEEQLLIDKPMISNREDGIRIEFKISKNDDIITNDVLIYNNDIFVHKEKILERIYDPEIIKNTLKEIGFRIEFFGNNIMDEEQKYKYKYICRKV